MPEIKDERHAAQDKLFERLGVSSGDRAIMADLAKHAAKQALASIQTVALTVPDPRMVNTVMISACLLLGESAERTVNERFQSAIDKLSPDLREQFAKMFEDMPEVKAAMPKGVRDFDGKYQ